MMHRFLIPCVHLSSHLVSSPLAAFVESVSEAVATPQVQQHLAPVASFHEDHHPHSLVESTAAAEAAVDAAVAATVTAHGKSHSQMMVEIEARGPALWEEFKARFKKAYKDETNRFKTFLANLIRIATLNAKAFFSKVPKALRVVYSHLSPLADQTEAEFKALLGATRIGAPKLSLGAKAPKRVLRHAAASSSSKKSPKPAAAAKATTAKHWKTATKPHSFLEVDTEVEADAETEVDAAADMEADADADAESESEQAPVTPPIDCGFREYGSPIITQGQCGSCYAFAAKAVLESAWALKTGKKEIVSPQQLLDCYRARVVIRMVRSVGGVITVVRHSSHRCRM
jgi:hypothetical protein